MYAAHCNENGKGEKRTYMYICYIDFYPTRESSGSLHIYTYILPLLFYPIELIINGETREHEQQTSEKRVHMHNRCGQRWIDGLGRAKKRARTMKEKERERNGKKERK